MPLHFNMPFDRRIRILGEGSFPIVTCGGLCPGINNVIRTLVMELHSRYSVRAILGIPYGYRGFIPKFIYHALHNKPYVVYKGHKRIIDYVEDTCRTFANIVDNFRPGEVYNVGGELPQEILIDAPQDVLGAAFLVAKADGADQVYQFAQAVLIE